MQKFINNMNNIWVLTKRNMLIFLKNPTTVFFSLLAPLLIFAIFILFMSKTQAIMMEGFIPAGEKVSSATISSIINAWMVSGVVGIACLTVGFNSVLIVVRDKENKVINDFTASPISPVNLLISYFLSAVIITFLICLIILVIVITFLWASTGIGFSFGMIMELLLVLVISCLSSVMIMMFALSFFKTIVSTAAFTSVYTALIGFITGAYFPLGSLPETVQTIAALVPGTHSINLFRNIFVNNIANHSQISADFYNKISAEYAFDLHFLGLKFDIPLMYVYLAASAVLFFGLYLIVDRIKARRKKRSLKRKVST